MHPTSLKCWPIGLLVNSDSMSREWGIQSVVIDVHMSSGEGLDLVSGGGLLVTATPCAYVYVRLLDVCELNQTSQLETTSERSEDSV